MFRSKLVLAALAGLFSMAVTPAFADASAGASAWGSPGVLSGNVIQVPVHVPVNVCGNSVDLIGLLNPAADNTCFNS